MWKCVMFDGDCCMQMCVVSVWIDDVCCANFSILKPHAHRVTFSQKKKQKQFTMQKWRMWLKENEEYNYQKMMTYLLAMGINCCILSPSEMIYGVIVYVCCAEITICKQCTAEMYPNTRGYESCMLSMFVTEYRVPLVELSIWMITINNNPFPIFLLLLFCWYVIKMLSPSSSAID